MQMSVANLLYDFSETSTFFWTSSKNAYRLNIKRAATKQHRTDTEHEWNEYGTDTERDQERMWNGKQNAFCQAFPVRFLLIGAVYTVLRVTLLSGPRKLNIVMELEELHLWRPQNKAFSSLHANR